MAPLPVDDDGPTACAIEDAQENCDDLLAACFKPNAIDDIVLPKLGEADLPTYEARKSVLPPYDVAKLPVPAGQISLMPDMPFAGPQHPFGPFGGAPGLAQQPPCAQFAGPGGNYHAQQLAAEAKHLTAQAQMLTARAAAATFAAQAQELMAAAARAEVAAWQASGSQPSGGYFPMADFQQKRNSVRAPHGKLAMGKVKTDNSFRSCQHTTVMLRNLPNDYSRDMLLDLLVSEGLAGRYDFVYLPTDFKRMAGLGYAFVNMVTPEDARQIWAIFQGFSRWRFASQKVCEVAWGQPLQGLEQHIERYRNSPVMHTDVPDEFKPAIFMGGQRMQFPPPTKQLRAPQARPSPSSDKK
jgi:hypothetical protein